MKIVILGAGSFGSALAVNMAHHGADVTLVARRPEHAQEMRQTGVNAAYLPQINLPKRLNITDDTEAAVKSAEIILAAMPMQKMRAALTPIAKSLAGLPVISCSKGIELGSGLGPVQVIAQLAPKARAGILTGPSFSHDIARDLPTALTLAYADTGAEILQSALSTPSLRLYRSADVVGAQMGGALKNVMAIACGAAIGAGLGDSARAALMTRGFAEMNVMAQALGAKAQTLSGLSGFGDLVLTCTSEGSRNYRFGLSLGQALPFDPSITVEGAATARAALAQAKQLGIEMPITQAVVALAAGETTVQKAMTELLSRPLKKEETC